MIPRFIHRYYAWQFGYFWLPCPRCGKKFGGHQWRHMNPFHTLRVEQGYGKGMCPKCGKQLQREWATR